MVRTAPVVQHDSTEYMLIRILDFDALKALRSDANKESELDFDVQLFRRTDKRFAVGVHEVAHGTYDGGTGEDDAGYAAAEGARRIEPVINLSGTPNHRDIQIRGNEHVNRCRGRGMRIFRMLFDHINFHSLPLPVIERR